MWSAINTALNLVFDVLLWPVQSFGALVQAFWLGVPAALLALLVFRYASNQAGIERAKDRIKAHLLEIRLYKDDFRVSLAAQGNILRHNLAYLGHALAPMAIMIVPFVLMLVQVETRLGYRGLAPGESTLLTVAVGTETPPSSLAAALELPEGLAQETPALRIDGRGEIIWRLRATRDGTWDVPIQIGERRISKRLQVGGNGSALAPSRYRADDWFTLGFPAERPLDVDAPAHAVHVSYPPARGQFAGLSTAAWVFFGSSILFGFALRGVFGVTF